MTRKEQLVKVFFNDIEPHRKSFLEHFLRGAEWADENSIDKDKLEIAINALKSISKNYNQNTRLCAQQALDELEKEIK